MNKTKTIAFRVTDTEYEMIEKAAQAAGITPSDWCRQLSLKEVGADDGFSQNDRVIFEELAKVRYLVGIGFGLLASNDLNAESWNKTKQIVDEKGEDIIKALLQRRR